MMDVHSKEGIEKALDWINDLSNNEKIPLTLHDGFIFWRDFKSSLVMVLNQIKNFKPEEMMNVSAHANWDQAMKSLSNLDGWNVDCPDYLAKRAELRLNFVGVTDKKEAKKEIKKHSEISNHANIIRKFGAFVDESNYNIAIPEGVSLAGCVKSLEFLKKKGFTTTRPTFN